jgi:uncharacterized protein YbjT (DUF2867 family)
VSFSFLRPTYFHQVGIRDAAPTIKAQGHLYRPGAGDNTDYRYNSVDIRDIADAAAVLLTSEPSKYHSLTFTLSGPESHTPTEWANIIGEAIGKKVQYIPIDDVQFYNVLNGLPELVRWMLVKLMQDSRQGLHGNVYGDYEILTGKKGRTVKAYLQENLSLFV